MSWTFESGGKGIDRNRERRYLKNTLSHWRGLEEIEGSCDAAHRHEVGMIET